MPRKKQLKKSIKELRTAFKPGKAEKRLKEYADLTGDPRLKSFSRIADKKHKQKLRLKRKTKKR